MKCIQDPAACTWHSCYLPLPTLVSSALILACLHGTCLIPPKQPVCTQMKSLPDNCMPPCPSLTLREGNTGIKISAVNPWTCRLTKTQNHHSLQNGILSIKELVMEFIFAKVLFSILTTWLDVPCCGFDRQLSLNTATAEGQASGSSQAEMLFPCTCHWLWETLLLNGWQHLL